MSGVMESLPDCYARQLSSQQAEDLAEFTDPQSPDYDPLFTRALCEALGLPRPSTPGPHT
jgi:hypothetical protein